MTSELEELLFLVSSQVLTKSGISCMGNCRDVASWYFINMFSQGHLLAILPGRVVPDLFAFEIATVASFEPVQLKGN